MLKKDDRLTKNNDFDKVFKDGRKVFLGILGIRALKNDRGSNRYGILVGEKVSKKAVIRNKVKRRVRQAVRNIKQDLEQGFDIIITTTPAIKDKKPVEIEEMIRRGSKRLRIL